MVALHARHATVVISAEDTVIARPAALLKTRISEALLRREFPAIKALGPASAESPGLTASLALADLVLAELGLRS